MSCSTAAMTLLWAGLQWTRYPDDKINDKKKTVAEVEDAAKRAYDELTAKNLSPEELCSSVYEPLAVPKPPRSP
jgi:hypothetical protein